MVLPGRLLGASWALLSRSVGRSWALLGFLGSLAVPGALGRSLGALVRSWRSWWARVLSWALLGCSHSLVTTSDSSEVTLRTRANATAMVGDVERPWSDL